VQVARADSLEQIRPLARVFDQPHASIDFRPQLGLVRLWAMDNELSVCSEVSGISELLWHSLDVLCIGRIVPRQHFRRLLSSVKPAALAAVSSVARRWCATMTREPRTCVGSNA
jgi:hypothetical protein